METAIESQIENYLNNLCEFKKYVFSIQAKFLILSKMLNKWFWAFFFKSSNIITIFFLTKTNFILKFGPK